MDSLHNDSFFQVPLVQRTTSEGVVGFPILYFDARCVQAFFWCKLALVEEKLIGTGLRPAMVWRGSAIVGLAFFEYLNTSIGLYNEAGLAIPVLPSTSSHSTRWLQLLQDVEHPGHELGFHIAHLPVTTNAACAAGKEIWGYPKFVTDIPFSLSEGRLNVSVRDPGDGKLSIAELKGQLGAGVPTPTLSLLLYSSLAGQRLRTKVNVRGKTRLHAGAATRLEVGASDHPMADTLRQLGLSAAIPVALTTTQGFQSRLNLGVPFR